MLVDVKREELVAVVQAVVAGNHGRYAVTISDDVEGINNLFSKKGGEKVGR